jgi:hypothetical protein
MASFMLVSAVCVELVVSIEALMAKFTFGMSLEPTLVNGTGVIVAEFLVLPKLRNGEQFMLMGEHLFVPRAEVTEDYQDLNDTT